MLDTNTMRAIGRLIARQARKQAPEAVANDVIDLGPLLAPWKAGTMASPVAYAAGDVRTYNGQPMEMRTGAYAPRGIRLGAWRCGKPVGQLPRDGRGACAAMGTAYRGA